MLGSIPGHNKYHKFVVQWAARWSVTGWHPWDLGDYIGASGQGRGTLRRLQAVIAVRAVNPHLADPGGYLEYDGYMPVSGDTCLGPRSH